MRIIFPLIMVMLSLATISYAEGTRELAPNGSIVVNGNETTDLAALHINHPAYNFFASYDNPDSHSRLYIHITDPAKECVYLGFSFGHLNVTSPNPTRINYEYRIKDPAGNIVFGPVTVPTTGGNIAGWSQGFTGPMEIYGAGGYDALEVTGADLSSQGWTGAGDYYIEFQSVAGEDLLIDFWDITVVDCSLAPVDEKKGRVWSYNWSIFAVNDFGFPNRPFNGAFYVCAPDPDDLDAAFITKIDFNGSGFQPAAFNVAFNSFGISNTGNITEDRKSVELINATQSEYAIFLNDPIELCKTAVVGEIELIGISRCSEGDYCVKFTTTKEGQIDLLLDFDQQDDIFTAGTRDVLLSHFVTTDEVGIPTCIKWDGLDGLGNPVPEIAGTEIPIVLFYAQGIYHFPIYDAELMITGFMLEAVRPAASIPLLHYDDSNITVPSGSGEPPIQITGCNVPCHRWTTFVNNNVPGFGNLHTINSWWFSQRILRQEVLLLPAYYTCEIDGPQSICAGGTTQIVFQPNVHPAGLTGPEILSTTWSGPGIIGTTEGDTITIGSAGHYEVHVTWVTAIGDTCHATCDYSLIIDPPLTSSIDTLILQGEVININGELYSEGGQYIQNLTTINGCDSILTINVKVLNTIVYYDLDACWSFMSDGSHMDYSEFTATQPEPLTCADISASIVFRENPQMNKHSCTPGVNNSVAMCISSLDTCDYDAGNQVSLVFELTITPDPDTAVQVTGLNFFEQAPVNYNWISGDSGPNNFPTLFGLRVLKNGTEIYRQEDIATTNNWTEKNFTFLEDEDFIIDAPATFRFELLPYCLVDNGAVVAAWDIDELNVQASCVSPSELDKIISGVVKTPNAIPVSGVEISLSPDPLFSQLTIKNTAEDGRYVFESNPHHEDYYLLAYHNTDFLEGVSTLDLIQIQKHLLGIRPFNSPYQYIAADANKNHKITAMDLIELRKLILGIYAELPNNTSWRFGNVDAAYEGGYPWGFKESIDIESLTRDIDDANFTGVKIGDVNYSFGSGLMGQLESRSTSSLQLEFLLNEIHGAQQVRLDVTSQNFDQIAGFQFALQQNGFTVQNIISGALVISEENYAITGESFRMSWNSFEPASFKADEILFSLIIEPDAGWQGLTLDNQFNAEAYMGHELEIIAVEVMNKDAEVSVDDHFLFPNEPNPFTGQTVIPFQLAQDGVVQFTFHDVTGRTVGNISGNFAKGMNRIEVSASEIGIKQGVVTCRMQSGDFIAMQRMVILQ